MYDIKELCPVPPPYGGVSVYAQRLVNKLTAEGLMVGAYYFPEYVNDAVKFSPLYDSMAWDGGTSCMSKFWGHIKMVFRRAKEVRPYRLVHSHCSLEDMLIVWVVKNICHKKVIVTIHNSMQTEFYKKTDSINQFFMRCLAKADITWIAVSEQGKQAMLQLPLKFKNEIHVIPAYIPIDVDLSKPLSGQMLSYIKAHKRIITFYGHSFMLHNGKDVYGFEPALELYADMLKYKTNEGVGFILCLAEDRNKTQIDTLHSKAAALGVDDKIFWQIGAIDNMQSLWAETDVYIRPTNTEGDSVAVREALDLGVRVVASNVCLRPEGVVCYEFGNGQDFLVKVQSQLEKGRGKINQDFTHYNRMRDIYKTLLA